MTLFSRTSKGINPLMKKQFWLDASMVISVLIADQILKEYVQTTNWGLHGNFLVEHDLIPGILALTKLHNNGAAWSFMEGKLWFFYLVTAFAIAVISYAYWKMRGHKFLNSALALIFAGTLGNFVDRVRQGFVVDMFDLKFINFPIFNIADVALTVGVLCLFVAIIRDKDIN